ncbi:hypothetical protein M0D21_17310 [Aquimarina sp. D1M17]|uniref:hypothetical protein n=1 Tax=Aquimarina acroporae TaxID=2937283 RepID=UPI0020C15CB1|nr:hypothetical protein [Aquimarina acroporae]MCK8523343.1 hypothetical protein [Aquimarina acroporae]
MSEQNQNEEIDLMQLFVMVKEFFKKFLRLVVEVVLFFKKKIVLFLILGVLGAGFGFFMDQYQGKKDAFVQEIILEPKYDSVEYIYGFIEDLEDDFKDEVYIKKLGLEIELVDKVKSISLEPIIKPSEVLEELQDKEGFTETYDDKLLQEKKYRGFYSQHKLTISFMDKNEKNISITNTILDHLRSNEHFVKVVKLEVAQIKNNLEQNKKSLKFVNDYLTNLSENPSSQDQGSFVFASESETPTIASLFKRKQALMDEITEQEKELEFGKQIYEVVENTGIIAKRKALTGRLIFSFPLILIGLISLLYFFRYLSKSVVRFINE